MMRKFLLAAVAVGTLAVPLCALAVVGLVLAAPAFGSTLSGQLTSASGTVAGGFIAATGVNGGAGAVSDSSGAYTLTLPDGTYRLAANAPGYRAAILPSVTVSRSSTQDVTLTASGAAFAPLPIFGGSPTGVAADGTPGVLYVSGGNVGDLFRSVDYGGTWTPVTVASDDPTNGLSGAANPQLVTTSGFPGRVCTRARGARCRPARKPRDERPAVSDQFPRYAAAAFSESGADALAART